MFLNILDEKIKEILSAEEKIKPFIIFVYGNLQSKEKLNEEIGYLKPDSLVYSNICILMNKFCSDEMRKTYSNISNESWLELLGTLLKI